MKYKLRKIYDFKKNWFIYLILIIYIILLAIMIYYHEPWADEAHSWFLVKNDNLFEMLTKHLRYFGHPSLWYLILMIPAKIGLPYVTMSIISGMIATAGVYVFLKYSPFPKIIKALFPFSYFIFYQYAVIARSYVLLPF